MTSSLQTASQSPTGAEPEALVELDDLKVHFPVRKGIIFERTIAHVKAVDGVSFSIRRGETLGLVGESGCGKTTIGRTILKLTKPSGGAIRFDGADIADFAAADTAAFRRRVQAVFQDPYSSLNPRMIVGDIVGEPLLVHGIHPTAAERQAAVRDLLEVVGLSAAMASNIYIADMNSSCGSGCNLPQ